MVGLASLYEVETEAGRLLAVRLHTLPSVEDVVRFEQALGAAFARIAVKAVIIADWRQVNILAPDVADRLTVLLIKGRSRFERSAILVPREQANFSLQAQRVLRASHDANRRLFSDAEQLLAWVSEVLDPTERRRARTFLLRSPG